MLPKRLIIWHEIQRNQKEILAAGALPPLVNLLKSGSSEARENAAGVLWSLSVENPENRTKIANAGALPLLVNLLESSSYEARETAAGALMNLAVMNPENQKDRRGRRITTVG